MHGVSEHRPFVADVAREFVLWDSVSEQKHGHRHALCKTYQPVCKTRDGHAQFRILDRLFVRFLCG